jgi:hypothetical protein
MSIFQNRRIAALLLLSAVAFAPSGALAQQRAIPPQAASTIAIAPPMPGQADIHRMIWSTMAAVDGANSSGNYTVLRETAAPGFQAANDVRKLASIFLALRNSGVDLSQTMLLSPTFLSPPRLVQPGLLQVRGNFGLRPTAVGFEMLFQWIGGKWRMLGVAISTAPMANQQAGSKATSASPPPRKR